MSESPPIDVRAIAQTALDMLRNGDAAGARKMLEQAASSGGADATIWLVLAQARGALKDAPGRLAALDEALKREPRNLRAVLMKADHLAEAGDHRGAAMLYAGAVRAVPRGAHIPPDLQQSLQRAQTALDRFARDYEDFIRAHLGRAGFSQGQAPPRFSRAVDILVGKKQVYPQQPRYFFYPELAPAQFFAREAFPFLDRVEQAHGDICAELAVVVAAEFAPYVEIDPRRPENSQRGLAGNPNWSAYYMVKEGAPGSGAQACPKTMAAIADAPLCKIPGRAPGVLFSRLAPGATIPSHTGMLNTRLICHLPLVVPPGCEFRVGNEQYAWVEGKAWVFDDTIEHEAWNRSDRDRTILIFDVWRPDISEEERAAVIALCAAVDAYNAGQRAAWDA